jgi:hypothetical protein
MSFTYRGGRAYKSLRLIQPEPALHSAAMLSADFTAAEYVHNGGTVYLSQTARV